MNPKNAVSLREDLVKLACADQPRYLMWRFCLAIPNILIHSVSCHASCLYIQKIVYVSLRKICSARESTIYSSSRSVSCGFVLFRLNRLNAPNLSDLWICLRLDWDLCIFFVGHSVLVLRAMYAGRCLQDVPLHQDPFLHPMAGLFAAICLLSQGIVRRNPLGFYFRLERYFWFCPSSTVSHPTHASIPARWTHPTPSNNSLFSSPRMDG